MDPEVKSKLDSLEEKINDILILLERDVKPNCNKMSSHIDFVDNVYDNVKNPLGFICSRVGKLSSNESHSLTDK